MIMADIIIDAHALPALFIDGKFVEKVVESCDHIYIPSGLWREVEGRYKGLYPQLLLGPVKRLRKEGKLGAASRILLPKGVKRRLEGIRRRLRKCGASEVDVDLTSLAYERREKGQRVYLISNDRCLQEVRALLERDGIDVRGLEEFKGEYLTMPGLAESLHHAKPNG
jgi:hypothetical protein